MNANICPIVEASSPPPAYCPIRGCQHISGNSCCYDRSSAMEGNVLAVSEAYMVSPVEIQDRIASIQILILASKWFTHHTGENILDATSPLLSIATASSCFQEFSAWNKSAYSWEDVVKALTSLRNNTVYAHCG